MANPVLILHGWSDTAKSFVALKDWLVRQGRRTEDVFFGNYESMEDHVSFDDLADGLQTRLAALKAAGKISLAPFSPAGRSSGTGWPITSAPSVAAIMPSARSRGSSCWRQRTSARGWPPRASRRSPRCSAAA